LNGYKLTKLFQFTKPAIFTPEKKKNKNTTNKKSHKYSIKKQNKIVKITHLIEKQKVPILPLKLFSVNELQTQLQKQTKQTKKSKIERKKNKNKIESTLLLSE
jgi:hypothetical protein